MIPKPAFCGQCVEERDDLRPDGPNWLCSACHPGDVKPKRKSKRAGKNRSKP